MINLIPNEEKKKKLKDFYFRLFVVFIVMLAASIFVAAVALVPAYLLSRVKESSVEAKIALQSSEPMPDFDKETLAEVNDLDAKLSLIEKTGSNRYLVSEEVISEIVKNKMPDIKLTEIIYSDDPTTGKVIEIRGTAESRERLLLFKRTLEENKKFKTVDLPISNFVKGEDISFFMTIIPS